MSTQPEPRAIEVVENEYADAEYNGHTVRVVLHWNRNQASSMNLSRDEAETLADKLDHYLTETTE